MAMVANLLMDGHTRKRIEMTLFGRATSESRPGVFVSMGLPAMLFVSVGALFGSHPPTKTLPTFCRDITGDAQGRISDPRFTHHGSNSDLCFHPILTDVLARI